MENLEQTSALAGQPPEDAGIAPFALSPLRGVVFSRNRHGQELSLTTLKKWLRLLLVTYKASKVDLIAPVADIERVRALAEFARDEKMALSWRVVPEGSAPDLAGLQSLGLADMCLGPLEINAPGLQSWLQAAEQVKLPCRVHLFVPSGGAPPSESVLAAIRHASLINIVFNDPFSPWPLLRQAAARETLRTLAELCGALRERDLPVAVVGLPFCSVDETLWPCIQNGVQFYGDSRQYQEPSHVLAERCYRFGPNRIDKIVENLLARRTSVHNAIDASLLPWLQDYPHCYIRVWMFHKLTRHLQFLRRHARSLPESESTQDDALRQYQEKQARHMGAICARCRMRRICDHVTPAFRSVFPDLPIKAVEGEVLADPNHFRRDQRAPLDPMDRDRIWDAPLLAHLREEAIHLTMRETPLREISTDDYEIENRYTHHMPGAVRWVSLAPGELRSTVLTRVEPPFTLSFTVGGGIAEQVGFSFGRFAKIVCPMIDYSHRITLHVDREGHYVLLRDDIAMRPTEFHEERSLPFRLAGMLEPRICLINIDGMLLTQTMMLWQGGPKATPAVAGVKYSVIIISTRYTRRLQATLLGLAHQQGVDPGLFEVVVGYVPGLDATDDLIDTMRDSFPALRVVRAPFSPGHVRAKGFMINECRSIASGEWIVLLDADIVVPPDTFSRIDAVSLGAHFIAPDGRKMLTPETTAKILLGEARPWESFGELMDSPGEIRHREADDIPIGFFQCVRADILRRIPYHELDHFESSDWIFGRDVVVRYGLEKRLKDFYVLHLDHSGSQWYGTTKHR